MAKKAAAVIDFGVADVKLASGKSKASKPEQLDIKSEKVDVEVQAIDKTGKPDFVKEGDQWIPKMVASSMYLVDHCININQKIESLKTEKGIFEQQIIDQASTAKTNEADENDNFVKTINVEGEKLKIQIQFRDAYSPMDITMELPLRKIFGEKYDLMFEKISTYAIREGKEKDLKELLGDKFDVYMNTETSIKPTKNFQQTFFQLRKTFKDDQKSVIEKVKEATQSKPAVKYPK
jgi:hypothetical protein